jgi:plastocyanin
MRRWTLAGLCVILPAAAVAAEVRGLVRYTAAPPAPRPLEVTKDRRACGDAQPDESLLVSAGGLANVVVRIVAPGAPPAPARISLDQRGCRFVPHVQATPAGSTLEIRNGDPILHGVHGWSGVATAFNVPTPPEGQARTHTLPRPGVIRVSCDVHAWMSAWIVVVNGPHFAVTDGAGRFSIADVPPGEHTVIAWHERLGERVGSVKVPPSGVAELELSYP